LIERRTALGLSQLEVAERIVFWNNKQQQKKTLSRSAYCMYESGEVTPDLDKLITLARIFRVTPQWLAFGIEEQTTEGKVEEVEYDPATLEFITQRFWTLDATWLKSRFDVEPDDIVIVMVNDFTPDLKPGDIAIVREGVMPNIGGGEFVFAQDDELKAAFIAKTAGGFRIYSADNTNHQDVSEDSLNFLGQVIGKIGDL